MAFKTTVKEEWRGKEVKVIGQQVKNKTAFEAGLVIEGQAKVLAPVNWGYLAASITTQARTKGTEPTAARPISKPIGPDIRPAHMKIAQPGADEYVIVLVGTPVEYGPYQEFGTINNEAQAFLRPALAFAEGKKLTILMHEGRLQFKEYLKK